MNTTPSSPGSLNPDGKGVGSSGQVPGDPYQGQLLSDSKTQEAGATEKGQKAVYYPPGFRGILSLAGYFRGTKDFDPYIEESVTQENAAL